MSNEMVKRTVIHKLNEHKESVLEVIAEVISDNIPRLTKSHYYYFFF
jgi:hypothetical protein